jgi:hypothetical protein
VFFKTKAKAQPSGVMKKNNFERRIKTKKVLCISIGSQEVKKKKAQQV